ncbi:hypothetical protein LSH36_15g00019 [Paralvinella palmiformis]|uniref:Citrate transporter-like domain-containing protein n=1 Tax=Paralvinella palmiformis TaxID=53620 RepID=A0AAD9NIP6_9ANNE|nr:hypothetical protein LSH36_15g00019 [Paralvinella palmiformis]
MASCSSHRVGRWWKHFVIILTPLVLLLPLLLIPDDKLPVKANQCLYVMLLMAVYWCTEVVSLPVTACIPIFMFPMLSILTTEEVCNQLMFGFMLPTWFLSMWISNTATTAMMLPICEAILDSLVALKQQKMAHRIETDTLNSINADKSDVETEVERKTTGDAKLDRFAKGMTLAVAYAANTGGRIDTLLDWTTIQNKIPWGIVFLMGGGFSIAKASEVSGLSDWIADGLMVMSDWPDWLMVLVICLITAFLTEITSNVATCTILMPIVSSLAEEL